MATRVFMKELGGAQWIEVTARTVKSAFKTREGFSSLGKGLDMGKLSVTYKASDLAIASVFHTSAKQVRIEKDGDIVFEGYTEGSANVKTSRQSSDAWVVVTAYPYLNAIREAKSSGEIVAYDCMISDPSNPGNSIMHILWESMLSSIDPVIAGIIRNTYDVEFPYILKSRPIFFQEAGSSPHKAFTQLLGEYTLSMWLDGFTARFSRPYANDDRQIVEIGFKDIMDNPAIKTAPHVTKKRPVVCVSRVETFAGEVLFSLDEDQGDDSYGGVDLVAGASYPEEGIMDISYSSSRESDTRAFYYAENPTISYDAYKTVNGAAVSTRLKEDVIEAGGVGGRVRLVNDTGQFVALRQMTVMADRAFFLDTSRTISGDCEGEDDEIETEYLVTNADVEEYIRARVSEQNSETSSLKFSSGIITNLRPNTLVAIGDIPAVYLIRTVEKDIDTGIATYNCIMFELDEIDTDTLYRTGGQRANKGLSAYQVAVQNGFQGTVSEWLESLNGKGLSIQYCYGESTMTPPYDGEWLGREEFAWKYADYLGFLNDVQIAFDAKDVVFPGVLNGQYLWARTKAGDAATWVYYRMTGEEGESAKLVEVSVTPQTYTSNKRSLLTDIIECEAQVSGYTEVSYSWMAYPKGSPGTILGSGTNPLFSFEVSHQLSAEIVVVLIATCDGEQIEKTARIAPNVMQTTAKYLGCIDAIPDTAGDEPLVEGDYFVAHSTIDTTVNGVQVEIKLGECWEYKPALTQRWTMVGINGGEKYLNAVNGLLRSNADLSKLSSNSAVSWFNIIVANRVITDAIFAQDIEVGNDIRGGGYNAAGDKTGGPGFWLGSNGKAKVTEGEFDKASIKEADIEDAHLQDVSINGNIGNKAFCAHTLPEFSFVVNTTKTVVVNGQSVSRKCVAFDTVNEKISVDGSSYYGTTEKDLQEQTGAYIQANGVNYTAHSYVPIVAKRRTESNGRVIIDFYANNSTDPNTVYTKVATLESDDSRKWFTSSVSVVFSSGAESKTAGVVNLLPMNLVEASESQKLIQYSDGSKYVMGKGHLGTQWLPFYMAVANFIYGAESSVHTSRASVFEAEIGGHTAQFNGNVNSKNTTNTVYGAVFN